MSQEKLKEFQKELFEYDYTLKKIDTILMSAKMSPEDRELYQLNREACQNLKGTCSREMSEYARENRLSLLLPPLSKEEKDAIIKSMDEGQQEGEKPVSIKFDDIRGEEDYADEVSDSVKETEEEGIYKEHIDEDVEDEDVEDEDIEDEDIEDEDVEDEDVENEDVYNRNAESKFQKNEVINIFDFIDELKEGFAIFYGE